VAALLRIDAAGPQDADEFLRVMRLAFAEHLGVLDPPSGGEE
jgi:hypothetical protein